jgi:hypothetical protein
MTLVVQRGKFGLKSAAGRSDVGTPHVGEYGAVRGDYAD